MEMSLIFSGVIILLAIWAFWGVWFRDWGGKSYDKEETLIHFYNKTVHRIVFKFSVTVVLVGMLYIVINYIVTH